MITALALAEPSLPSTSTLPGLFLVVAFGSLLPVLPTGAAVSAAAVLAVSQSIPATVAVLVVAAVAAFLGDLGLYRLASWGGHSVLERLRVPVSAERLARAGRQLEQHGTALLTVSRLIPGGRVPVMMACIGLGMTMSVFAAADLVAAIAWAALYGGIGIAGGALFPHVWQGVLAGVLVVAGITLGPGLWRRVRRRRAERPEP